MDFFEAGHRNRDLDRQSSRFLPEVELHVIRAAVDAVPAAGL